MRGWQTPGNFDRAIYEKGMDEIMAEQKQQEELQQENEVLDKKQLKAGKK